MIDQLDVRASRSSSSSERHIMRREEVEQKTGFKRAHIYNLMKEGKFPKRVQIGASRVGWVRAEVEQWINARMGAR